MAANLIPVQPHAVVRPSAATSSGHQKSDSQRKSWWSPLFGWSSEPDYIDSGNTDNKIVKINTTFPPRSSAASDADVDKRPSRSRVSPSKFTDEKARKLRMLTMETETFHDAMYHSAIASRLASDFSDRSDV